MKAPMGYRDAVLCGRGATSRVYRATEVRNGRCVALKRLHRQLVRSNEALARLRRELEATDRLRHPAIVPVYDVVRWDGDPTIVMRFIPGEDLKERIQRLGALSFEETERIARALFDVLATSHTAGIVHRDVKPQNIRIAEDGAVFLVDFGSSRLDAASQLTHTGTTIGTPEYMAPELFCGPVYDPRVDIYGAGATLYECLTGEPPQSADSLAELAYLRSEKPIPPVASVTDAPKALAQVIDRCLSIEPEARYATAALALWALDNPSIEASYAARQKRKPLCVHCHMPIPPESGLCPSCKRPRPFVFEPGVAHVEIDSIEDPQRFIEFTVGHMPELAQPENLQALTEQTAALSFERQRYASYINERDAESLRRALREAGVHSHIVAPSGFATIFTALIGTMLFVLSILFGGGAGFAVFALALITGPMLLRALNDKTRDRSAILSTGALSKPLWPKLQLSAINTTLGLGALMLFPSAFMAFNRVTFPFAYELALASMGALSLFVSFYGLGGGKPARYSPVPRGKTKAAQWFRSLLPASSETVNALTKATSTQMGAVGQVVVISAITVMLPMELGILFKTAERLTPTIAAQTMSKAPPIVRTSKTPEAPTVPEGQGQAKGKTSAGQQEVRAPTVTVRRMVGFGVGAFVPMMGLLFALLLVRRRRRTKADAARLFSELDLDLMEHHASRLLPRSEPALGERSERALLSLKEGDAFIDAAKRRAAQLSHHLPPVQRDRMFSLLKELAEGQRPEARAAQLARCIMETDERCALRFELLALEGEMEAAAAEQWADSIAPKGHSK